MARLSHAERVRAFGQPCQGSYRRWVDTPFGLRVACHELVVDRFLDACAEAKRRSSWVPERWDSYACRKIRGSSAYSLHSWPLAWDLFDRPYPEPVDVWGPTNAPDADFLAAFRDLGFTPGADFSRRKDHPHIEWAAAPPGDDIEAPYEESLLLWA